MTKDSPSTRQSVDPMNKANPDALLELAERNFAWTPGAGAYKHYPQYVNLTGNRLTVRGPEFVNVFGHYDVGPTVIIDLPDEVIAELAASLPQDKRIAVLERLADSLERDTTGGRSDYDAGVDYGISYAAKRLRAALSALRTVEPE